jgi:uncharacterized Rmd1/YagE family protein
MKKTDQEIQKPLFPAKAKNRLKLETFHTSEDDRMWKKTKVRKAHAIKRLKETKLQISGYSICEEINLKVKINILESAFKFKQEEECHIFYDESAQKYLFIFDFGVVIFWNFKENEERMILRKMDRVFLHKYPSEDVERDFMLFTFETSDVPKIEENTVFLASTELDEKFTHSYAFAQSLKLEVFETKVDNTIKDTEDIPKNLARSGEISMSQKKVYKMIGSIFMLRSSVNLLSGMLDVPDWFWDKQNWESIYNKARDYYDIEDRIEIINNRLDLIKELYDMLNDDLHNKHTANLEWIVIWLIVIELFVEVIWNIVIKDILKLA